MIGRALWCCTCGCYECECLVKVEPEALAPRTCALTLNLHGLTEAEAQAILDEAVPKECPEKRLWMLVNKGTAYRWSMLTDMEREHFQAVAAEFLTGYVKRSKIEAALAHRETITTDSEAWRHGYYDGHRRLAERIRKALEDE